MNIPIIKIIKNKNKYFKFSKKEYDCLIINDRQTILSKYLNMPRFKYLWSDNDKKKTSILIIPKNTSYGLKIGDVLTLEGKHII